MSEQMIEDDDDENADLESLLGELEIGTPKAAPPPKAEPKQEDHVGVVIPPPEPILTEQAILESERTNTVSEVAPVTETKVASVNTDVADVDAILARHARDYELIRSQIQRDRVQAAALYSILKERVEAEAANNTVIETTARVLQTLIDTSGHSVKLLDANAKILSATKSNAKTLIQNNISSQGGDDELQRILSQPQNEV